MFGKKIGFIGGMIAGIVVGSCAYAMMNPSRNTKRLLRKYSNKAMHTMGNIASSVIG